MKFSPKLSFLHLLGITPVGRLTPSQSPSHGSGDSSPPCSQARKEASLWRHRLFSGHGEVIRPLTPSPTPTSVTLTLLPTIPGKERSMPINEIPTFSGSAEERMLQLEESIIRLYEAIAEFPLDLRGVEKGRSYEHSDEIIITYPDKSKVTYIIQKIERR